MKKLIFFLLTITSFTSNGQDLIHKKDGTIIQSKVLEITVSVIKYKKFTNQEGPTYEISKTDVSKIVYPDGSVDDFVKEQAVSQKNTVDANNQMMQAQMNSMSKVTNGMTSVNINSKSYSSKNNELRITELGRTNNVFVKNRSAVYIQLTTTLNDEANKIKIYFTLTTYDMKPRTFKSAKNNELTNTDGEFAIVLEYLNPNINMGLVGNRVNINNIKTGKFVIDAVDTNKRTISGTYQVSGKTLDKGSIDLNGSFTNISY